MPHRPDQSPATGRDNHWVAIDVAAVALGVGVFRAYQIARADKWRHTPTQPRGYLMADIKATAHRRKNAS